MSLSVCYIFTIKTKVKDSVFLDADGPAVILQAKNIAETGCSFLLKNPRKAQKDGHLEFTNNLVTSSKGSGVTVTVRTAQIGMDIFMVSWCMLTVDPC